MYNPNSSTASKLSLDGFILHVFMGDLDISLWTTKFVYHQNFQIYNISAILYISCLEGKLLYKTNTWQLGGRLLNFADYPQAWTSINKKKGWVWLHLHIYSYAVSTPSKLWCPSLHRKELEVRILKTPDYSQLGTSVTKYDSIQDDLNPLMQQWIISWQVGRMGISQLHTYVTISVESLAQGHWSQFIKNFLCKSAYVCLHCFLKLSALIKNANYSFSLFFCKLSRH